MVKLDIFTWSDYSILYFSYICK